MQLTPETSKTLAAIMSGEQTSLVDISRLKTIVDEYTDKNYYEMGGGGGKGSSGANNRGGTTKCCATGTCDNIFS